MIYTIDMIFEKQIFQTDIQMAQLSDLSVPQNLKKNSLRLLEVVFITFVYYRWYWPYFLLPITS